MDLLGRQEGDVRRQKWGSVHYIHPCALRAREGGKATSHCTKEGEVKCWKEREGRNRCREGSEC